MVAAQIRFIGLPYPYGLIPHELSQFVENERVLPGINKMLKMIEDFPLLDRYDF